MMNGGHGLAKGGTDGPTAAQEIHLVVGVDAAAQMQRQIDVQQAEVRTGAPGGAALHLGLGAGLVR